MARHTAYAGEDADRNADDEVLLDREAQSPATPRCGASVGARTRSSGGSRGRAGGGGALVAIALRR